MTGKALFLVFTIGIVNNFRDDEYGREVMGDLWCVCVCVCLRQTAIRQKSWWVREVVSREKRIPEIKEKTPAFNSLLYQT